MGEDLVHGFVHALRQPVGLGFPIVELRSATLTNIEGFVADDPDLTITINRSDLEAVMMGVKSLRAQIEDGTAQAEGNTEIIGQLASTLVVFDPRFEIMPGTKGPSPGEDLNPYEVGPVEPRGE
jgi:hypothetical protein